MKTLFIVILFFLSITAVSQVNDSTIQIIDPIESMPTFPGGINSMFCFIETNLRYEILNSTDIKTKYILRFAIDTLGNPIDFEIVATLPTLNHHETRDSLIKSEILRVFKLMPKWNPAISADGKKDYRRLFLQIKVPYTQFKCEDFRQYKGIEYEPDKLADFSASGGNKRQDRINNFIYAHLKWPSEADCQGRVVIKFIVEESGKLTNFEFIRRLDPDFDEEALRVLKEMPTWSPAIKNNKPVRSIVVIPIIFVMH